VLVALGFVAHTGWAVAVAVGGSGAPRLIDRRRIELIERGSAGVFHAAKGLPLAEARRLVEAIRARAGERAKEALAAWIESLQGLGGVPRRCAIIGPRKPPPADVETILRSHALMHAAEGELYRAALAAAAEAGGLEVTTIPARELDLSAQAVRDLGHGAGAPWGRDQKLAALAAALRLAD
jgi:hypothetical protein